MEYYKEWIPEGVLKPYISRIWTWDGPLPNADVMRFLPVGTAQIFFSFSNTAFHCRKAGLKNWESLSPHVFIGPQFSFFDMTTEPMKQMAGIIFKPGGTLPFFENETINMVNLIVSLKSFCGSSPLPMTQIPIEEVRVRLSNWLIQRMRPTVYEEKILDLFSRWDGRVSRVDSLSLHFGMSTKRLSSLFEHLFGVRPKRFARVRRFNGAIREIFERKNTNLVDVAAEIGFYDQPHLNREFRILAGLSPAQYLEYSLTLYYFPLPNEKFEIKDERKYN